ncbi:MAG TPA: DEAD/DEAH box helicase [Gammaproteobacteria bacterium]|nr:DEAD/DEAH box helicase [Gammaproteobacteria bacterium]
MAHNAGWTKSAFASLEYIVIDEFHAFIGRERGQQLMSLLNRLEHLVDRTERPICRTALSATLGDLQNIPKSLRPNGSLSCAIIEGEDSHDRLKLIVKGYLNAVDGDETEENEDGEDARTAEDDICDELFHSCRGDYHLVFANNRNRTETLSAKLLDLSESNSVPNEFFPHHGSLSKEARELVEERLQKQALPTTALCTTTLELGIDIGKVSSAIQINAPYSVSSLRQRMGRSGRRGDPSVLRVLIAEDELGVNSDLVDCLRLELLQSIAMIRLLVAEKWFEPAETELFHFSTLLHQVLAVISQWGGVRADQLYSILCERGPFQQVTIEQMQALLVKMGEDELVMQLQSGELVLASKGEQIVNRYTFYAVFKTPDEFKIVNDGKALGNVPVDSMILVGQHIIFGGRRWKVLDVDVTKKLIRVQETTGGKAPKFGGSGMDVSDRVRQEMFRVYTAGDYSIEVGSKKIDFLDEKGKELFDEGLSFFRENKLENNTFLKRASKVHILPWLGDKVVNTLLVLLKREGYEANAFGGFLEVEAAELDDVRGYLFSLIDEEPANPCELASEVPDKEIEKYDGFLPDDLLNEGFGRRAFDIKNALDWIKKQRDLHLEKES